MAEAQDDSQTGGDNQPEIQLTPEETSMAARRPDVAAGAAPAPDVAAGAAPAPDVAAGAAPAPARTDMTVAEMREWLRNWIADATGQSADTINDSTPMVELGLSSRDAVAMASDIEDLTGVTLTATVAFRHPDHRVAGHGHRRGRARTRRRPTTTTDWSRDRERRRHRHRRHQHPLPRRHEHPG